MAIRAKILHSHVPFLRKSRIYLEDMKTGTKILLGIAVIAALAAGVYYYSQTKKEGSLVNNQETTTSTTSTTSTPGGKRMAFSQFAQQGGTYKCTVSEWSGDVETKGVAYMNKGMVRVEFTGNYTTTDIKSYFIVRDGFTYTWNSKAPTVGLKIQNSVMPQGGNAIDQLGDYDCEAWTADASQFTVPTNLTFQLIN